MTEQVSNERKKRKKTELYTPEIKENHLFASGHTACAGCGQSLAARLVLKAAGSNIIVCSATGCLEVFSSSYPQSSWEVPWVHSLFENAAAIASGVEAALKATGNPKHTKVIAMAGDGGTADIGLQALSGMMERGHDVLYVCMDNGAYMNTGIQRSSLTPPGAGTTTTPAGKRSLGKIQGKKNVPLIAAAHGIPYIATATVGYPMDLMRKVKTALSIEGPKYLQIDVPCPLGWRSETSMSIELGKLSVHTGLFPLFELKNGKFSRVRRVRRPKPVEEYLKLQGRFRHLFARPEGKDEITRIQKIADDNIAWLNKAEWSFPGL